MSTITIIFFFVYLWFCLSLPLSLLV
nr:cytochrome b6/f complex subunit VI [Arceuthobium blumeri]UPU96377.1 cytochrome b6/f complex subunit VI [Arceuthobium blumeri]